MIKNASSNYSNLAGKFKSLQERFYEVIPGISERITWLPTRLLFSFFCSLDIKGLENLKKLGTNAIIASNHSSEADPVIITACSPFFSRHLPLFFVSREKEFYKDMGWKKNIYGGILFKMWGAHPAYVGLKNYERALCNHLTLLRNGRNVLIFPMGKINAPGEHLKARGGVSFLARETGLPIMPVLIEGARSITLRDLLFRKRKIRVVFGEPIYARDIFENVESVNFNDDRNDYESAATVLMEKIAQLA